ncbi:MAG: NAD(P)/FAD-dependent oxidoreductase [Lentilitoribacter sp.]
MSKIAILGAGAMGLAAAHHALKLGHEVTVFEADKVPGGMAAHFDFGGLSIERYYHFVCKTDKPTFDLMEELGIGDKMRWVDTNMAYYIDGKTYPWGDPISLLKFPLMSLMQKFRYGASAFWQTKRKSFDSIENLNAKDWITRDCGEKTFDLLWRRLFDLKFYEYADNISASWIATRMRRIGRSRRSIFQEQLGYIDGGTEILVNALVKSITENGGKINLGTAVQKVLSREGKVAGVQIANGVEEFDNVISTVPTPFISKIASDLTTEEKVKYAQINNIGVMCLIYKLKKPVSPFFWMNINDERIELPGIVEFSNLRPTGDHIVYVPYYMPVTNEKFSWSDERILDEAFGYLKMINPDLTDDDKTEAVAARLKYAQPICPPNFLNQLPEVQTSIEGLQIADTCFYYPEDRGISESVHIGKTMARNVKR